MTTSPTTFPVEFQEAFLAEQNGDALFLRSAEVSGDVKANILLTHGMGEHSARYFHVAECLANKGYRLCTYDLRGHGRSKGRRGHIHHYGELLDDLDRVLAHYRGLNGGPLFLYGHSLGGQITLSYLLQRKPDVAGAIITSPWLELSFQPPRWKVMLAEILVNLWPTFTQTGPNNPSLLSRDLDFLAAMPLEELTHHKVSARMFGEITLAARTVLESSAGFDYPLLLVHGAKDPLTSAAATTRFFDVAASSDKTLKIYPEMLHETHNEIGRETVLAEIVQWLDQRSA